MPYRELETQVWHHGRDSAEHEACNLDGDESHGHEAQLGLCLNEHPTP